ncbi:MAG: hypothetical protein GXO75_19430 [Calditrichaeota bacterium]|nr:hypothetical protein [Calditrichota bacterium]
MKKYSTLLLLLAVVINFQCARTPSQKLVFSCSSDNDLYRVATDNGIPSKRYDSPKQAVESAANGSGVLILADNYPIKTTAIDSAVYELAVKKNLRLYVEFPLQLPGMKTGEIRKTHWERGVVTSDVFGDSLKKMRIVMIQDCHFVPVAATTPLLVVAKIAGFDTVVYGLDSTKTHPILFQHPAGNLLVSTTKLSQFVTGRYAPKQAWAQIWKMIFHWLQPGRPVPNLKWTSLVRASFKPDASLPRNARRNAIRRGVEWYSNSRLLMDKSWKEKFVQAKNYYDRVGPAPSQNLPAGDGSLGILEGFNAKIKYDGSQPIRWYQRADCSGEAAMAIALEGLVDSDKKHLSIAGNLLDFLYFNSNIQHGPRANPASPSYGLLGWDTTEHSSGVYYGDDNARAILGTLTAAAALKSGRWDEAALRVILANFRTSGPSGFRKPRIEEDDLQEHGWKYYWQKDITHYAPHYQAWIWACYLWLYNKTNYQPLLDRTKTGIRKMMQAYPDNWHWTNGLQQERARMVLPLAWLIRVEDTPEHRAWLKQITDDLLSFQDTCGAIREEIGHVGHGSYAPPKSNREYGTTEAPLIQENGDPLADMLYTSNFALFSLTEAAAATGEAQLKRAVEKLADFMIRIQVRSKAHPELDGAWFRAFDFNRWEYWASNADAGWGAWSTETGWTQGWIVSMLAMQELQTNLWDFTADSKIAKHFEKYQKMMLTF